MTENEKIPADYKFIANYVTQNHISIEDYKEYPVRILKEVMEVHERKFGAKSTSFSIKRTLDKVFLNRSVATFPQHMYPEEYCTLRKAFGFGKEEFGKGK